MARKTTKTKAGARKAAAKRKTSTRPRHQESRATARGRQIRLAQEAGRRRPNGARKTSNGLPLPSTTSPGALAGKALDGVRILDFTHVQSGPTCTQLLGYMGADVIKIERPGVGDITRGQLRDVPNADSLYFTMLNGNKRSITIDSQAPQGQGDHRAPDQALRRAGGELRARAPSIAWASRSSASTRSTRA